MGLQLHPVRAAWAGMFVLMALASSALAADKSSVRPNIIYVLADDK